MKCTSCSGKFIRVTTNKEQEVWRVVGWVCEKCGLIRTQRLRAAPSFKKRPPLPEMIMWPCRLQGRLQKLSSKIKAGTVVWDEANMKWNGRKW